MKRHQIVWYGLSVLAFATLTFADLSKAAENIGTVRQPLVGGSAIDEARQEEFGLLGYSDGHGRRTSRVVQVLTLKEAKHV